MLRGIARGEEEDMGSRAELRIWIEEYRKNDGPVVRGLIRDCRNRYRIVRDDTGLHLVESPRWRKG